MSTRNIESKPASVSRFGLAAALAVAALMSAPAAHAADTTQGLRVYKDPVTGQLRAPTAEEVQAMDRAERAKTGGKVSQPVGMITGKPNPKPIKHADGTIEQELDDSTMSYSVATRAADGSTELYCVTGKEEAASVMKGKKTGAKIAKEHNHDHK